MGDAGVSVLHVTYVCSSRLGRRGLAAEHRDARAAHGAQLLSRAAAEQSGKETTHHSTDNRTAEQKKPRNRPKRGRTQLGSAGHTPRRARRHAQGGPQPGPGLEAPHARPGPPALVGTPRTLFSETRKPGLKLSRRPTGPRRRMAIWERARVTVTEQPAGVKEAAHSRLREGRSLGPHGRWPGPEPEPGAAAAGPRGCVCLGSVCCAESHDARGPLSYRVRAGPREFLGEETLVVGSAGPAEQKI